MGVIQWEPTNRGEWVNIGLVIPFVNDPSRAFVATGGVDPYFFRNPRNASTKHPQPRWRTQVKLSLHHLFHAKTLAIEDLEKLYSAGSQRRYMKAGHATREWDKTFEQTCFWFSRRFLNQDMLAEAYILKKDASGTRMAFVPKRCKAFDKLPLMDEEVFFRQGIVF